MKVGTIPLKQPKTCKACDRRHYAIGYCKKHYTQVLRHGQLTPAAERGDPRPCGAPGCERVAEVNGHCRKHARQIRVHGKLTPELERVVGADGCRVEGCDRPHRAKGFCDSHYQTDRLRRLKERSKGKPKRKKKARRR